MDPAVYLCKCLGDDRANFLYWLAYLVLHRFYGNEGSDYRKKFIRFSPRKGKAAEVLVMHYGGVDVPLVGEPLLSDLVFLMAIPMRAEYNGMSIFLPPTIITQPYCDCRGLRFPQ